MVTVSSTFGAGGGFIARGVADALGVPFLDRLIPAAVAAELAVPLSEAEAHDQHAPAWLERLLDGLALAGPGGVAAAGVPLHTAETFRSATERVIREQAESGGGVILGRAAGIVLAEQPGVLRVRLDGPASRREAQSRRLMGMSEEQVHSARVETDGARSAYLRHFYGREPHDASLYELTLDSTVIGFDTCIAIIVLAARGTVEGPGGVARLDTRRLREPRRSAA